MLQIDNTIISLDVIEEKFTCDLKKCKGACCVLGDSGAPLESKEIDNLTANIDAIKPYMRAEGIQALDEQGLYTVDSDNDKVTPLINGKECAFVIFEDDIAFCSIERAYNEGRSTFRKPISCYLYPVRVKKFSQFTAVNYDRWDICSPARKKGKKNNLSVLNFLEVPLTEKFGKEWVKKIRIAEKEYLQHRTNKS